VIWLIARLYLGYEWLKSGWERIQRPGSAAWMKSGVAVKGFSQGGIPLLLSRGSTWLACR
jgi:thiosulfate dehydrogenase [quinone] large subunit